MPLIKDVVTDRIRRNAQFPESKLLCPGEYDFKALEKYIPKEVLDVSEGNRMPYELSNIRPGEAILIVGSGAGLDCFEAARRVGPEGHVIGIDLADDLLAIARRNAPKVTERLGLPASMMGFHKGEAQDLPVDSERFDRVISNCLTNLSKNKQLAFEEVYRVLRADGRFATSDIVADQPVPKYIRAGEKEWGPCVSGSLGIADYLKLMREEGFVAVEQLIYHPWKLIDGVGFYSSTLRAQKLPSPKNSSRVYEYAVYKGPFLKIKDEYGNVFQRGQAKKISRETSLLLSLERYRQEFVLLHEVSDLAAIEKQLRCIPFGDAKVVWEGDFAILSSLFLMAEDDEHQAYYAGQPVEISNRAKQVFQSDVYKPFFSILNRSEEWPPLKSADMVELEKNTAPDRED